MIDTSNGKYLHLLSGGFWAIESVELTPSVSLESWQCFELQLPGFKERTRHLAGNNAFHWHGQVSSAICAIDPHSRKCRTASGRAYELGTRNGLTLDGEYTWNLWLRVNIGADIVDVTAEINKLLEGAA